MLIAMLQHPEFETYKPTTLRAVTSGGAPVPVAVVEQVTEHMDTDVVDCLRSDESTGGITLTLPHDSFERKSATVGIPYPHVDVKLSILRQVRSCLLENVENFVAGASW